MTLTDIYTAPEFYSHFLFNLLAGRHWYQNISHKGMPTYDQHVEFIMSKPYAVWYVISIDGRFVGSVYLSKQDEVGIFLIDGIHGQGIGGAALANLIALHPRQRYLANINPANTESIQFFAKYGFHLIQKTFEYVPNQVEASE